MRKSESDTSPKNAPSLENALRNALSDAWRLRHQRQWSEAASACHSILSQHPDCDEAWHLLGLLALDRGAHDQAVRHLEKALSLAPEQPDHHCNLGVILHSKGDYARSKMHLSKALEIDPHNHDARCNLGLVLYHQRQWSQAAQVFESILDAVPGHTAALANLGMTRLVQQQFDEAVWAYEKAIALEPQHADWHGNLGAAHVRRGDFKAASNCFRKAAEIDGRNPDYRINLGIALRASGDLAGSIQVLDEVVSKNPSISSAVAHLVVGLEYTCQWERLEPLYPLLDRQTKEAVQQGRRPSEDPMLNIRRCQEPAENQSIARAWSRHSITTSMHTGLEFSHSVGKRGKGLITIGYLSYDYRNHPMAHQLHPLFAMHDRSRFRVVAFSMGPKDGSRYRSAVEAGCDEFVDIGGLGLVDAANAIYDQKVDILVDLMGHSHHNRMDILALRPAPLQVAYLGFLSTTGAPFIDYLIADPIVAPKEHTSFFDEKLIRLPHCYQFNHMDGIDGGAAPSDRKAWGLPSRGFVFCSFNNPYKIDRKLFETWMRILKRTPGSVLWLSGGHEMASRQMRSKARELGVDPDRLVIAEKLPLREHLKRIPMADLALDTLRYNGGATTANALASGVPVLTVMGRHWVSRMTASHLMAVGLPELIRPSLSAYEETAVNLAHDRHQLAVLCDRLEMNKHCCPLFDSKRFLDHLEAGYETIWQRYIKGFEPAHVDIPALNNQKRTIFADGPQNEDPKRCAKAAAISGRHPVIYYFCPDIRSASAGIRRLYRHVAILNNAGFPAFLLHEKPGFEHTDMPHVPSKNMSDVTSDADAVFVIPEGMPRIMHLLKDHPGRIFAMALSWVYVYSTLPEGVDWRDFNIERVMAVSPAIADMIHWTMGLPVHLLTSGIDHKLYYKDPSAKRMQISYIHRKAEHATRLQAMLASRNPDYLNKFKWVELDGLTQEAYAAQIRRSAVFLATSLAEGFPTSCLEAMAAGALVAGYDGVGGKEILSSDGCGQTAISAPNGDYATLAYKLAPVLDDLLAGRSDRWDPVIERGRQISLRHTAEKEAASLTAFWKWVLQPPAGDVPAGGISKDRITTSCGAPALIPDAGQIPGA